MQQDKLTQELAEMRTEIQRVERARMSLQRQLEGVHEEAVGQRDEVIFIFPPQQKKEAAATIAQTSGNPEDERVSCSRSLVRQWSPAFKTHLHHGNSFKGDSPHEMRLDDTTADAFRTLSAFMNSGILPDAAIPPASETAHPLLGLADRFGVMELKETYLQKLQQREPLTLDTAAGFLGLASSHNVPDLEQKAAVLIATNLGKNVKAKAVFLKLDIVTAKIVLTQDVVNLKRGKELAIFELAREWVATDAQQRAKFAGEIFQCIRFGLMGIMELSDLEGKLDADEVLRPAANELLHAIRAAYVEKLACSSPSGTAAAAAAAPPIPMPTRKRKATTLVAGSEEENLLKVMRTACRLGIGATAEKA